MSNEHDRKSWEAELNDIGRALSGAFLFGIPLLYTMEVWWKGNTMSPPRMMAALVISFGALVLLIHEAGFRKEVPVTWWQIISDSMLGLVLAMVASAVSLAIIGMLHFGLGIGTILGRITMETIPFSIGAGISNFLVEKKNREGDDDAKAEGGELCERKKSVRMMHDTLLDAGATVLGSTIIAFSIAPTDEILFIASKLSSWNLLIIIAASLLSSYTIVFESSFVSQKKRRRQRGIFQHPLSETIFSYLLSLLMAMAMLWLFQLLSLEMPFRQWVSYTIVLGLPAAIGGAAGRIAV